MCSGSEALAPGIPAEGGDGRGNAPEGGLAPGEPGAGGRGVERSPGVPLGP